MPNGKVRALCAQIAIELNPTKADTLIAELTRILVGEYAEMKARVEQELRRNPAATEQQEQVIAAARLPRK